MKACMAMSITRLCPGAQRPPQEPLVDTPRDGAAAFDDDNGNLVLVTLEDGEIGGDVDGRDVHLVVTAQVCEQLLGLLAEVAAGLGVEGDVAHRSCLGRHGSASGEERKVGRRAEWATTRGCGCTACRRRPSRRRAARRARSAERTGLPAS